MRPSVSRETQELLAAFVDLVVEENTRQNLIASSTVPEIWQRHIIDSLQLAPLMRGDVIDVGSGSGFPGVVLALLGHPVHLVEP